MSFIIKADNMCSVRMIRQIIFHCCSISLNIISKISIKYKLIPNRSSIRIICMHVSIGICLKTIAGIVTIGYCRITT